LPTWQVRTLLAAAAAVKSETEPSVDAAATLSLLQHAQAVWASPLARCVQTALVALQPLLAERALPLELKPNAREQRLLTNLHTSVGNSCGEHIRTRCVAKMRDVSRPGDDAALIDAIEEQPFATEEVTTPWWSATPESEKVGTASTHALFRPPVALTLCLVTHATCRTACAGVLRAHARARRPAAVLPA
jgi:hypothetical protein